MTVKSMVAVAAAVVLLCHIAAAQRPEGPGVNEDFATVAEGYTSAFVGGRLEAFYRMFSAPDFAAVCRAARAGDVRSLRARSAHVDARVAVPIPYATLEIDALDALGVLVPRVPIMIESYRWSDVLDTRSDHIGEGSVTPKAPGTTRLRIRTICDAPGGDAFVDVRAR